MSGPNILPQRACVCVSFGGWQWENLIWWWCTAPSHWLADSTLSLILADNRGWPVKLLTQPPLNLAATLICFFVEQNKTNPRKAAYWWPFWGLVEKCRWLNPHTSHARCCWMDGFGWWSPLMQLLVRFYLECLSRLSSDLVLDWLTTNS